MSVSVGLTQPTTASQQPARDLASPNNEPLLGDTSGKDASVKEATQKISISNEFPPLAPPTASLQNVTNPASTLPTEMQGQRMKPVVPNLLPSTPRSTMAAKQDKQKVEEDGDRLKEEQSVSEPQHATQGRARKIDAPSEEAEDAKITTHTEVEAKICGEHEAANEDATEKRQQPKKLDIPATERVTELGDKLAAETSRLSQPSSSTSRSKEAPSSDSRPETPSTAVSQSSAPPTARQPRTLRVVSTPRIDTTQKSGPKSSDATAKVSRASSKQSGSRAITTSSKQARAPVPEASYDSGSVTSTPISRPTSPNSKFPLQASSKKVKGASKKEPKTNQESEGKTPNESPSSQVKDVVQEPIVGRKKKSKKPKVLSSLQESGDGYSDSPLETPGPAHTASHLDEQTASSANGTPLTSKPVESPKESLFDSQKPQMDSDATRERNDVVTNKPLEKAKISAAALYGELVKQGRIDSEALSYFLHPLNGGTNSHANGNAGGATTPRLDAHGTIPDPDGPTALVIADADKRRLDNGEPIIVRMDPPCHAVILPDRSMLRFLLRGEAERYLRLRCGLAATAPHAGLADLPVEGSISIAGGLFGKGDEEEALLRATAAAAAAAAADGGADFCLPHPQDLEQELSAAAVAPDDAGSYSAYYTRGPPGNEGLAERMVHMSLEDAAFALRGSEEMLAAVRKETEVLEKKLGQAVKKNRKMLKEWSRE